MFLVNNFNEQVVVIYLVIVVNSYCFVNYNEYIESSKVLRVFINLRLILALDT